MTNQLQEPAVQAGSTIAESIRWGNVNAGDLGTMNQPTPPGNTVRACARDGVVAVPGAHEGVVRSRQGFYRARFG